MAVGPLTRDGDLWRVGCRQVHQPYGRAKMAVGHGHAIAARRQAADGGCGGAGAPEVGVGRRAPADGDRGAAVLAVAVGGGEAGLDDDGVGLRQLDGVHQAATTRFGDGDDVGACRYVGQDVVGAARVPLVGIGGRASPARHLDAAVAVAVAERRVEDDVKDEVGGGVGDDHRIGTRAAVDVGHGHAVGAGAEVAERGRGGARVPEEEVGHGAAADEGQRLAAALPGAEVGCGHYVDAQVGRLADDGRGGAATAVGVGSRHGVGACRQIHDGGAGSARAPQVGVGRRATRCLGRSPAVAAATGGDVVGGHVYRQCRAGQDGSRGRIRASVGVGGRHGVGAGRQARDGGAGGARAPGEGDGSAGARD